MRGWYSGDDTGDDWLTSPCYVQPAADANDPAAAFFPVRTGPERPVAAALARCTPPAHRHSSAQFQPDALRAMDKGRGLPSCSFRHESLRHHDPHCDRLLQPFVHRRVRRHRRAARVLNVSPDFRPSGVRNRRGFFSAPWFASGGERSPNLSHHENQTTSSGASAPTSPTCASPPSDRSAATLGHGAPAPHGLPRPGVLSRHGKHPGAGVSAGSHARRVKMESGPACKVSLHVSTCCYPTEGKALAADDARPFVAVIPRNPPL